MFKGHLWKHRWKQLSRLGCACVCGPLFLVHSPVISASSLIKPQGTQLYFSFRADLNLRENMLSRLRNNGPVDLWVIINYYANSSLTVIPPPQKTHATWHTRARFSMLLDGTWSKLTSQSTWRFQHATDAKKEKHRSHTSKKWVNIWLPASVSCTRLLHLSPE